MFIFNMKILVLSSLWKNIVLLYLLSYVPQMPALTSRLNTNSRDPEY